MIRAIQATILCIFIKNYSPLLIRYSLFQRPIFTVQHSHIRCILYLFLRPSSMNILDRIVSQRPTGVKCNRSLGEERNEIVHFGRGRQNNTKDIQINIKIVNCCRSASLSLSLSLSLSSIYLSLPSLPSFLSIVPIIKKLFTRSKMRKVKGENGERRKLKNFPYTMSLQTFSNPFPTRIRSNEIE